MNPFKEARITLLAAAALLLLPAAGWAQTAPDDATPGLPLVEKDSNAKDKGAEQDDATNRREWQRQAWGVVSPAFRTSVLREGNKHTNKKNAPGPKWVTVGPAGANYEQNGSFTGKVRDSGRARTVLPHPTNPEVVYFLTSGGGLWRTNNWSSANTKWEPLTDDLPTTGGGAVAFGANPQTLYLGLGDPYDQILVGGAMTKSRNGGVTWDPIIELGSAVSVRDVKVDTSTNRDIVLVATDNGLFRSADEGGTYQAVPAFAGMSVWSIVRTSAGWLASAQPCAAASVGLRCGLATVLFLSTDRGASWTPITNAGNVFSNNGRTTLGVGLPGDSVVYAYATTVNDAQMRDVYRSSDGGQTWVAYGVNSTKAPTNPVTGNTDMNICHGQCWYNQMILVDPRDPNRNTVWIGGDLASARTTDGGSNWKIMTWWLYSQFPSIPYAHADHHAAVVKLTGTPTVILGDDGGLHITTDDGATFSSDKNNGLVSLLYYTVAGHSKFPNLVIGGTQDNGTRLRTDNSLIHDQVIGGDGMGTNYSIDNTNTVMGSAQGSAIRTNLSNNPPIVFQNWAARGPLTDSAGAGFFTAVIPAPATLDPSGRVFFHFTNSRVWRTNDGGLNWILRGSATAPVSPGLPSTRRFRSSPYNLGVSPSDLNRIAVGAAGGFMDVTTDGGANWTDLNLVTLVPGYLGFVSNVTWADNQTLWITSTAQAAGAVRVIKATIANPAASWATATFTVMQNGLPDLPVNRVYVDPRDATKNTLYAATHVGLYRTIDGGANWTPYGNGLPTVRVNDIYMPPDGGFIRIATYGRGIWELSQLELQSITLSDNGACDRDGILDNGETGNLTFALRNWGPNNVNQIRLTITSSNPKVTFPRGNVLDFPPVQKFGDSYGSIQVALNGASGIETTDFQIAVTAPELGLPSPLNLTATYRLNYDDKSATSATDSVESAQSAWTVSGGPTTLPNILAWQRRALSPTSYVWWGPNNNGQLDGVRPDGPDEQILTSPVLKVGSDPLTLSFRHRFSFEGGGWDGGVIELTQDGGATWIPAGGPGSPYNGATNPFTAAPIGANRPAFVNRIIGWPAFTNVSVNLGTTYAGKDVRIRFRIGADETVGAPGWEIDDIAITGLVNTPFSSLVPQAASCPAN